MRKYNKILLLIFISSIFLINSENTFADSNKTSELSGKVVSGNFFLSIPNNLNFKATLNGKKQIVALDSIKTIVTDYRGIQNGWQIIVKSPNFDSYKQNYQIQINKQEISGEGVAVYKVNKQTIKKKLNLPTNAEIFASAKAGSCGANLEWNLQPNIKITIKE